MMAEHAANNYSGLSPVIIGVADSIHYLVGAVDSNNNLFSLPNTSDISVFRSLFEAKKYLASQNISSAYVEYQSAYDEMCGSSVQHSCRQMITF